MRIKVVLSQKINVFHVRVVHSDSDIELLDHLLQWDEFLREWRVIMIAGRNDDHYCLKGIKGDLAGYSWNELKDHIYDSCLLIIKDESSRRH